MVARRSAAGERTRTINQARALLLTGPDDLRARFTRHTPAALVTGLASLRPRPGDVAGYAVRVALRELGRRARFLDGQLQRLDELIVPLVTARAPGLLAMYGLGPRTAALLLITAGDHPGRLRSEAAWAHLCGVAPIPASSGKVTRHRLNPGGDRQANHALWRIVFTRLGGAPRVWWRLDSPQMLLSGWVVVFHGTAAWRNHDLIIFPLCFIEHLSSCAVQLPRLVAGCARQAAPGGLGISSSGTAHCAAGSPGWSRVTLQRHRLRRRRRP